MKGKGAQTLVNLLAKVFSRDQKKVDDTNYVIIIKKNNIRSREQHKDCDSPQKWGKKMIKIIIIR